MSVHCEPEVDGVTVASTAAVTVMDSVSVIEEAVDSASRSADGERHRCLARIEANLDRIRRTAFNDDIDTVRYIGCQGPFRIDMLDEREASDEKVLAMDRLLQALADLSDELAYMTEAGDGVVQALQASGVRSAVRRGDAPEAFARALANSAILDSVPPAGPVR